MQTANRRIVFWGNLIRQIRENLGWSKRLLAERAQVNRHTLGHIEAGRARGDIDVIERLLEAMGYEVDAVHSGTPRMVFHPPVGSSPGCLQLTTQPALTRLAGGAYVR